MKPAVHLLRARVTAVTGAREGLQELEVERVGGAAESELALAITAVTGMVAVGDEVILNVSAVDLGLGTGGAHFVVADLSAAEVGERLSPADGHLMKLRYTPAQLRVFALEEEANETSPAVAREHDLRGMPVIAVPLHSHLLPVAATLKKLRPQSVVAYAMTDGGALALAVSDNVAEVRKLGLVDFTVTCGQAFGGDYEALNLYSGLLGARALGAHTVIVGMGPGNAGSASPFGFSGIEQGANLNAVAALGGRPIAVPRVSFADSRERHRGLSHHSVTVLGRVALSPAVVPFAETTPKRRAAIEERLGLHDISKRHLVRWVENRVTEPALAELGAQPQSMGRSFSDDPDFFLTAGAAAIVAAEMLDEEAG